MAHKNNKNSKNNKKVGQKTKKELAEMKIETSNELGVSNESKKLGKNKKVNKIKNKGDFILPLFFTKYKRRADTMKRIYIKEAKHGEKIDSQFMILKKIYKDGDSIIAYMGDKTGDIKVKILDKKGVLDAGDVIECSFIFSNNSEILNFKK